MIPFEEGIKEYLRTFACNNNRLALRSKHFYVCDLRTPCVPACKCQRLKVNISS